MSVANNNDYFSNLDNDSKSRYLQKIQLINHYDPYTFVKENFNVTINDLPVVTLSEIIIYFAVTNSFWTGEQVRAYKSLEAYKFVKKGWVVNIDCAEINDNFLVLGEVTIKIFYFIKLFLKLCVDFKDNH